METSSLGTWQVEDRGDLVLDDTFDPADKAAQKHLLDACGVARAWPCEASGCSFGMLVRHGQTSCAYEGWQEHLARKYPDDESKVRRAMA